MLYVVSGLIRKPDEQTLVPGLYYEKLVSFMNVRMNLATAAVLAL